MLEPRETDGRKMPSVAAQKSRAPERGHAGDRPCLKEGMPEQNCAQGGNAAVMQAKRQEKPMA